VKPAYQLTVVIAVQYAQENLPAILRELDPAAHPDVEFLFCSTTMDPDTAVQLGEYENVNALPGPVNSLIPQLWRVGIVAARADKVALSTAHCVPESGWVDRLMATDMTMRPGIGGVIVNDDAADARAWAIYLLRYISFSPPQQKRQVTEIAADNAIYRRRDILEHADLLEQGFWEPSFHSRFRQAGMVLELHPELRVIHHNQYTTRQFFAQRLAHGKAFGLARAREISTARRVLLITLSPLLPVLFLAKTVSAVVHNGRYTSKLLSASPWLLVFLFAWGLGEVRGYLSAGSGVRKK